MAARLKPLDLRLGEYGQVIEVAVQQFTQLKITHKTTVTRSKGQGARYLTDQEDCDVFNHDTFDSSETEE